MSGNEPFVTIKARALPLRMDDVDTDQIIPGRFLSRPRMKGYGAMALHDLRFSPDGTERDCVMNDPRYTDAKILVAGRNFGCGSSREAAVWSLIDEHESKKPCGFRVVIAESFGDIFYGNALKNGLLPIRVSTDDNQVLLNHAETSNAPFVVSLEQQTIETGDTRISFDISSFARDCLMRGLDEVDITMQHQGAIARYEERAMHERPWVFE